jgi:subtilisin-like proprotein convertase family protein
VTLNIAHSRASDLQVNLRSANGTVIELFSGLNASAFQNTTLDDEALSLITTGSGTFSASYRPTGNLASLEGQNVTGTWTLEVKDVQNAQTGSLNSWILTIQH